MYKLLLAILLSFNLITHSSYFSYDQMSDASIISMLHKYDSLGVNINDKETGIPQVDMLKIILKKREEQRIQQEQLRAQLEQKRQHRAAKEKKCADKEFCRATGFLPLHLAAKEDNVELATTILTCAEQQGPTHLAATLFTRTKFNHIDKKYYHDTPAQVAEFFGSKKVSAVLRSFNNKLPTQLQLDQQLN